MPNTTKLLELFAAAFGRVLSTTHPAVWNAALAPEEPLGTHPALPAAFGIALQIAGGLEGSLLLYPEPNLAAELFPSTDDEQLTSSWLSLVEQVAAAMQQELSSVSQGTHVEGCRVVRADQPVEGRNLLLSRDGHALAGAIKLECNDTLRNAIAIRDPLHEAVNASALTDQRSGSVSIQRVIDVPLAVVLRFGQRQLTLRELMDLNTGSLVELDRQVEEPVELMLGERVIARGDVVIVDGNYGLRVTEVVENTTSHLALHG